jgi:hypothetical protein
MSDKNDWSKDRVAIQLMELATETMHRVLGILGNKGKTEVHGRYMQYKEMPMIFAKDTQKIQEALIHQLSAPAMGTVVSLSKEKALDMSRSGIDSIATIQAAMMFNLMAQIVSQRNKLTDPLYIAKMPMIEVIRDFVTDTVHIRSDARIMGKFKNDNTTEIS